MRIRRRFAVAALALGLFSGGFAIAQASWAVPGTVPAQQQESAERVAPASGRPTGRPTSTVQDRDDHDPGPAIPSRRGRRRLGSLIALLVVGGIGAVSLLLGKRRRNRRTAGPSGPPYGQVQHPQAVYGQPPQPGASPPPGPPQAPQQHAPYPQAPYPRAPYPQTSYPQAPYGYAPQGPPPSPPAAPHPPAPHGQPPYQHPPQGRPPQDGPPPPPPVF